MCEIISTQKETRPHAEYFSTNQSPFLPLPFQLQGRQWRLSRWQRSCSEFDTHPKTSKRLATETVNPPYIDNSPQSRRSRRYTTYTTPSPAEITRTQCGKCWIWWNCPKQSSSCSTATIARARPLPHRPSSSSHRHQDRRPWPNSRWCRRIATRSNWPNSNGRAMSARQCR